MIPSLSSSEASKVSTSGFSSSSRYNGLIDEKPMKKLRNMLENLFIYLDSSVAPMYLLHKVVTVFRILQLIGMTFCTGYQTVWAKNSNAAKAVAVISVFFNLIPPEYRDICSVPLMALYIILHLFFFIVLYESAKYYSLKGKLNSYISYFIVLYVSLPGYLLNAPVLEICGEEISRLLGKYPTEYTKNVIVIFSVLTVVFALVYYFFYRNIYSFSLIFRPTSMLSITGFTQMMTFFATFFQAFLTGLNSFLLSKYNIVGTVLLAATCVYGSITILSSPSFVSLTVEKVFLTFSTNGVIIHMLLGIYGFFGRTISTAELFCYILMILVIYLACSFGIDRKTAGQLAMLDSFVENAAEMENYENPKPLINATIIGFGFSHPCSLSYSVFKHVTEKWKDVPEYWCLFAKFVAIYPEENNLLSLIIRTIVSKNLTGGNTKQCVSQAENILAQREPNFTTKLKLKMEKTNKHVQSAKRKLRRIWDQVIQGNVGEMESSINSAYDAVLECQTSFNRLLTHYPNNRFVARSYSRFLYEVKADYDMSLEWNEKVRCLQRGVMISSDLAQELGFKAYPNLPPTIAKSPMQVSVESNSATTTNDNDMSDEQSALFREEMQEVKDLINNLSIPAPKSIIISTVGTAVMSLVITIAVLLIAPIFQREVMESVTLVESLSYLQMSNFLIPALSHRLILEKLGKFTETGLTPNEDVYGKDKSTAEMLRTIAKKTSAEIQVVSTFNDFNQDDSKLDAMRETLYKASIPYKSYTNGEKTSSVSLMSIFSDYIMQALTLVDSTPDATTLQNGQMKNAFMNCENTYNIISDVVDNFYKYISDEENRISNSLFIAEIIIFVVFLIGIVIIGVIQRVGIKQNELAIYKCLMSLPKNVVSSISENLRILKKGSHASSRTTESDSDQSKQEENMLKVFATANDITHNSEDTYYIVICNLLLFIFFVLINYYIMNYAAKLGSFYSEKIPNVRDMMKSAAATVAFQLFSDDIYAISLDSSYEINATTEEIRNAKVDSFSLDIDQSYAKARFGDSTTGGFTALTALSDELVNTGCDYYKEPSNMYEAMKCQTADALVLSLTMIGKKITIPSSDYTAEEVVEDMWKTVVYDLIGNYFVPTLNKVDGIIQDEKDSKYEIVTYITVLGTIALVIIVILMIREAININGRMKFSLNLLLSCPGQSVFQNQKIMSVLAGNFNDSDVDAATRDSIFYDALIYELPDSVIQCDQNNTIIAANKTTEKIFGCKVEGQIDEFLRSSKFSGKVEDLINVKDSKGAEVEVEYTPEGGDKQVMAMTSVRIAQNLVITTRNVTQAYYYNKLIQEEKGKSDRLLMSILPASLVSRVQAGETNISFSVQSASIIFMDIVEFTPWCAANSAQKVTSVLNMLFREFDSIVNSLHVLSKIKCIGDCYMCAGGIFSDVNDPANNAREACEFGLSAIKSLGSVNEQIGESLRIRVGIHVGGPIVAGVIGIDKPTFEIFGPAISMAQQMEHHGVPMKVHVSRTVYELIYGGSFNIEERGEIEIKNGKVITYLIT